jgi:hypothetical protein
MLPLHQGREAAGAGVEPADPWFKATYFYRQKLPRKLRRQESNLRQGG